MEEPMELGYIQPVIDIDVVLSDLIMSDLQAHWVFLGSRSISLSFNYVLMLARLTLVSHFSWYQTGPVQGR